MVVPCRALQTHTHRDLARDGIKAGDFAREPGRVQHSFNGRPIFDYAAIHEIDSPQNALRHTEAATKRQCDIKHVMWIGNTAADCSAAVPVTLVTVS